MWATGVIVIAVLFATLFSQEDPHPIGRQVSGPTAILDITVLVFLEVL
jgi:hypothetical protein